MVDGSYNSSFVKDIKLLDFEGVCLNSVALEGTVFSGEGVGARFVGLPWVREQIRSELCFDPFLGTLNLHLKDKEAKFLREKLKGTKTIEIIPQNGFYKALCFRVLISKKINGYAIIPKKPNYPLNVLEIVAATCLRKALSLNDGDKVEVTLVLEAF